MGGGVESDLELVSLLCLVVSSELVEGWFGGWERAGGVVGGRVFNNSGEGGGV